MNFEFKCSGEHCGKRVRCAVDQAGARNVTCPNCSTARTIDFDDDLIRTDRITVCPACQGSEFFIRKDFPQRLGLAIVVGAGLASVWLLGRNVVWAYGVLGSAVAVDFLIYWFIPKVTVCYQCRSEFRDMPMNPSHSGFDLATAEKYRPS
jgi:hypothetical protein